MRRTKHMTIGNERARAHADRRPERWRAAHDHYPVKIQAERRLAERHDVAAGRIGGDDGTRGLGKESQDEGRGIDPSALHFISSLRKEMVNGLSGVYAALVW